MPQLGETVTEGTIIRWLKNVGDTVAHDEPLFEVSTDKVDSEVPSSEEGYLTQILVEEGATVDVGTPLAVIGDSPGANGSTTAPPEHSGAEPAATEEQAPAAPESEPAPAAPQSEVAPAGNEGALAAQAPGTPMPSGQPAPPATGESASLPGSGEKGLSILLSPVVRKLLTEHAIDPASVRGSGAGGRITRNDVLSYIDSQAASSNGGRSSGAAAPATPASRPPAPVGQATEPKAVSSGQVGAIAFPPASAGERDEVIPFTNIRRLTAEHMVRSKATSAHTLVAVEVDFEQVERVRARRRAAFREAEGVNLTYLPFVARAVVDVLRDYRHLNASVAEDALILHRDVHLGIAGDMDRQGLIVPVVRSADGQSLRGLARAMNDLAGRARSRRLSADDVVGGTFTITNPGPFGTFITAPIINQPQVAILSTDGVKRRPVVVTGPDGSEAIAIHSVGMLAMSFDHRAVDGAYASAFLHALAGELEGRDWSVEL
jgi:pyruvate dehydrogenase E2 component (dihydrolipoamide acetyltransferase)